LRKTLSTKNVSHIPHIRQALRSAVGQKDKGF